MFYPCLSSSDSDEDLSSKTFAECAALLNESYSYDENEVSRILRETEMINQRAMREKKEKEKMVSLKLSTHY